MKSTAGISFAKKSLDYSKLIAHNKRHYKNDKNENIDPKYSSTNCYLTLLNWKKLWKPKVKSYVKNHNQHAIKTDHRSRVITVNQLLNKKYQNITRCGIITIGNSQFRQRFEQAVKDHQAEQGIKVSTKYLRRLENGGLVSYAKLFNMRHHHLKIGRIACHGDEGFIHAHAEFIALPGKTKKGKPSFNFSRALKQEYHQKSNKYAMRSLHKDEDPKILHSLDLLGVNASLMRTHNASPDDEYQHSLAVSASVEASSKASLASSFASLASSGASLYAQMAINGSKKASSLAKKSSAVAKKDHILHSLASKYDNQMDIANTLRNRYPGIYFEISHSASSSDYRSPFKQLYQQNEPFSQGSKVDTKTAKKNAQNSQNGPDL